MNRHRISLKLELPILCLCAALVAPAVASASGSGPAPSPQPRPRSAPTRTVNAVEVYNKGVELMRKKKFRRAQKKFEKALAAKDFAEAHNNLGYCLRKQGPDNYQVALKHYDRAIELDASLPEPRMYRGVLYVQMGRLDDARREHAALVDMGSELAGELQWVLDNGTEKEPEQFFGVSAAMP